MTKRDRIKFKKLIETSLRALGARTGEARLGISGLFGAYHWDVDTPQGLVAFTVYVDSDNRNWLGWVAGRFQNVAAGKSFGANPHSGKWNHYYFENWTPDSAAIHFQSQLSRLFPTEDEAHEALRCSSMSRAKVGHSGHVPV
jgi:hypothetical protein